jgi:23S rRNA pseudouridine1911/1915/1917 synthase
MGKIPIEQGGQTALTEFRVLKKFKHRDHGPLALVECKPKTGRQHQIRIHLALENLPILGDKLYGIDESRALMFFERKPAALDEADWIDPRSIADFPRHALHAFELAFDHPVTGKRMQVRAPWPEDLAEVVSFLPHA